MFLLTQIYEHIQVNTTHKGKVVPVLD